MSSRKRKTGCVHYHYVGDYGLETCRRDGIRNERMEFNCRNCPYFRTHTSGLERCPFCGGKAWLGVSYEFKNEWEVTCIRCHARIKAEGADKAAEKWNIRK